MSIETKKLNLIERFMKLREESAIQEMEVAITKIEMNNRADASIEDIKKGRVRSYDEFSTDVKEWIKNRKSTK